MKAALFGRIRSCSTLVFCGLFALLMAIPLMATDETGAERSKRPVRAEIVPGGGATHINPIGNVRVSYSDGTTDMWTRNGDCSLPRVSTSGVVGWTVNDDPTPYQNNLNRLIRPNNLLVLVQHGRVIGRVCGNKRFIEDWGFADEPARVVLRSRWMHGPADIELYDIKSGDLVQSVSETGPALPAWAKTLRTQAVIT